MKNLRILVGDDQIGVEGSLQQKAFLRNYNVLGHNFDFESNPDRFIERAKSERYDALLIDLDWKVEGDNGTTGFRLLHNVRECAPIRMLHTSNEINDDLFYAAKLCGATACIEKHRSPEHLNNHLKGGM